jgi:diguanylate cyclase (GGDEF)-like protein
MKDRRNKRIFLTLVAFSGLVAPFVFDTREQFFYFYSVLAFFIYSKYQTIQFVRETQIQAERFRAAFSHMANNMFNNVLEADITKDSLLGERCDQLTDLLKIPRSSSYSATIEAIADCMIQATFSAEYKRVLSRENILEHYAKGCDVIEYECIERSDMVHYTWIRIHIAIFWSEITNSLRIISYVKNIDKEKSEMLHLEQRARSDPMTGFYNKTSTEETIQEIFDKSTKQDNHAIIMMDIDDFKKVNDTFGHIVGDRVIIDTAKRIKCLFCLADVIGRVGGDEFLICMSRVKNIQEVEPMIANFYADLSEFCINTAEHYPLSFSIGVAIAHGGDTFEQAYKHADAALYYVKNNKKGHYVIYENGQL